MEEENKQNKIDTERIKRFKEKFEYSNKLIKKLKEWTKNVSESDFTVKLTLREQFSIYHAFQIISEVTADLIAMVVKDINIIPKNDYTNIDVLIEHDVISNDLAIILKKINGLRNQIVHNYNNINEGTVYKEIKDYNSALQQFNEVIEKWLRKHY